MKQLSAKMSVSTMKYATADAQDSVERLLALAEAVELDSMREERLKRHECRSCFYRQRVGGSAMTARDCMCCHEEQQYPSTATDVLCLECAKKHSLCKHCGGDLDMRFKRRNWPEADPEKS